MPGAAFITPAVGQFVRNGKPRIVTGDDSGVIYSLDENGKLLWRQDRIFGPKGVPDPLAQYQGISEIGLADLDRRGERQVVATTKSGETVAPSARGGRLWWFTSYERKVGTSLAPGAHLAFADLEGNPGWKSCFRSRIRFFTSWIRKGGKNGPILAIFGITRLPQLPIFKAQGNWILCLPRLKPTEPMLSGPDSLGNQGERPGLWIAAALNALTAPRGEDYLFAALPFTAPASVGPFSCSRCLWEERFEVWPQRA
jgi:hypothetical protein